MIEKDEVLKMAAGLSLSADAVEKDYVLGWLLHGISQESALSKAWVFKGGTSLKKCYFETFRFSEDLDFTVINQDHLSVDFLKEAFFRIADSLYEEVGIEFFKENFKFKILPKENNKLSVQGKIAYNGPLRRKQKYATIKLDLTTDEILVLDADIRRVHHPYSDEPESGIFANCYAFEEVVAEKVRALAQRARPRDVYDVVHFFRNRSMIENPQLVYSVLTKKCSYKQMQIPDYAYIEAHEKREELEAQWENMLAHQLSSLPPLESFWKDIEPFFDWLVGSLQENRTVEQTSADFVTFQPGRVTSAYSINSVIQKIQFAAANRVCVKLTYSGKERTVEPLSFRKSQDGNRLFYGFEREDGHAKAFSLSRIQNLTITNIPYTEKYPVEISAAGSVAFPPIRRESNSFSAGGLRTKKPTRPHSRGPTYIYKCSACGKQFRRKTRNSKLNAHKNKHGYSCSGRSGYYVDTRY